MTGMCRYMGGAKCAGSHCDFWSNYHKRCITAVKDEQLAEVCEKISALLDGDPEILDKLKDAADVAEKIRKLIDK